MTTIRLCTFACVLLLTSCVLQGNDGPTVDQFKFALDKELQSLLPEGYTKRTILFEDVRKGASNGPKHTFVVTLTLHDYSPGYPPNDYYGVSCVGRMENWEFDMVPNAAGEWVTQGMHTITNKECKDNPAEGQMAIPVEGLPGQPARAVAMPAATGAGDLVLGEYACYGTGGRMMTGMGFELDADGSYTDLDGERGGDWEHDKGAATITFSGGYLDGQRGTGVTAEGFAITGTVSCEPY